MIDKLFRFEDKNGNLYDCTDGKLTLYLKKEKKVRKIGRILEIDGKRIFKKFEQIEHVHRATDSWSVPVEIFEKIDEIWFYTDTTDYKITKKEADKNKQYLSFIKAGIENKVYIPLTLWYTKERNSNVKKDNEKNYEEAIVVGDKKDVYDSGKLF
jgi:hypothetical protein